VRSSGSETQVRLRLRADCVRSSFGLRRELLPSLTRLEWKASTSRSLLIGLPHFLTPGLRSLAITLLSNDATFALRASAEFLESIRPPLCDLDLIFRFTTDARSRSLADVARDVGHIVQIFPDLQSLRTDVYALAFGLEQHHTFPNLQRIYLERYMKWGRTAGWSSQVVDRCSADVSFPRLAHIRAHTLGFANFFPNNGSTVRSFSFSQPDSGPQYRAYDHSQLIEHFKEIGDSLANLTSLRLHDIQLLEEDADLKGSILPLSRCRSLEDVDILAETDFVRSISDDDITHLAREWPRLVKFAIRHSDIDGNSASLVDVSDAISVSLISVISLIQHCPLLQMLSLSFNATSGVFQNSPFRFEGPYRLERLDLGYSLIADATDLAIFLPDLCPAAEIGWESLRKLPDRAKKLISMKSALGNLQLAVQTQRGKESIRQTVELRRRNERLVEEVEDLRRGCSVSEAQNRALRWQIEFLRAENEAFRSAGILVPNPQDVKP
jgi:hypothetical protein